LPAAPAADRDDVVRVYPGVVPLMMARGAGAEMRQTLGTAVFSGMLA